MVDKNDTTSSVTGAHAAVMVLGLGLIIMTIVLAVISKYPAKDAVTVLTAVIGPLVGLGAAAFGVSLQATAKAETAATKEKAAKVSKALDDALTPDSADGTVRNLTATGLDVARLQRIQADLREISR